MKNKILIINGPNLQLLGKREVGIYGNETLEDIAAKMSAHVADREVELVFFQSCIEGEIVERIGQEVLTKECQGIIINPGAYSHTSIAILDALRAVTIPVIEVHLSNIHAREGFRHDSMTAPVCIGQIAGLGADGYEWAFRALVRYIEKQQPENRN